jgi:hypothetical protein
VDRQVAPVAHKTGVAALDRLVAEAEVSDLLCKRLAVTLALAA